VARNRPRRSPARSPARPGRPLPATGGGASRPPIEEEPPVAFDDDGELEAEAMTASAAAAFGAHEPERARAGRVSIVTRTVNFLRGSWAELRRVQWPDRQQVVQATSVVLGFVALMGVFLGVADYVAGKLINAII
jgi:preprotein translocase SecE subunit